MGCAFWFSSLESVEVDVDEVTEKHALGWFKEIFKEVFDEAYKSPDDGRRMVLDSALAEIFYISAQALAEKTIKDEELDLLLSSYIIVKMHGHRQLVEKVRLLLKRVLVRSL